MKECTWEEIKEVWNKKKYLLLAEDDSGVSPFEGLDSIELSPLFRIAEMVLRSDYHHRMYADFVDRHQKIQKEQIYQIIDVIKKHTCFEGGRVCDVDDDGNKTFRYD